jgi:hypothetical protein
LIEFGLLILEKIKKKYSVFLLFCCYLPLERGIPLHLKKCFNPLPSRMICAQSLVKVGPVALGKKIFK